MTRERGARIGGRTVAEKAGTHTIMDMHEHGRGAEALTTSLKLTTEPATLAAGASSRWTLRLQDRSSGQPVTAFDAQHGQLIHLIVASTDLSWFNHLHPAYAGDGIFTITTTLPRAGAYHIYADITPTGRTQQVPRTELRVNGRDPLPATPLLTAGVAADGWLTARVPAAPEGEPDIIDGPLYEVALMPMPATLVAGHDAMLHFQVRDASARPLHDLEPYLGALGHAVILSADGSAYLHAHPADGDMAGMDHGQQTMGGGPDVTFHTSFPDAGLYKAWGQFQHQGRIITASFVLAVQT